MGRLGKDGMDGRVSMSEFEWGIDLEVDLGYDGLSG